MHFINQYRGSCVFLVQAIDDDENEISYEFNQKINKMHKKCFIDYPDPSHPVATEIRDIRLWGATLGPLGMLKYIITI